MSLYDAAGEAGHQTSTDMREAEATSGKAAHRQAGALAEVDDAEFHGATWAEVAKARGWHHGQASSALSTLHRRGLIARLEASRDGCGIYVTPEYVHGRPTVPQGRRFDALTLARDVPLETLREALRIAETPAPNERTTEEQRPLEGRTGGAAGAFAAGVRLGEALKAGNTPSPDRLF
jgi:hypothetical protein